MVRNEPLTQSSFTIVYSPHQEECISNSVKSQNISNNSLMMITGNMKSENISGILKYPSHLHKVTSALLQMYIWGDEENIIRNFRMQHMFFLYTAFRISLGSFQQNKLSEIFVTFHQVQVQYLSVCHMKCKWNIHKKCFTSSLNPPLSKLGSGQRSKLLLHLHLSQKTRGFALKLDHLSIQFVSERHVDAIFRKYVPSLVRVRE